MIIDREVEMDPDQINFYIDSNVLFVRTNEKDEQGEERSPASIQAVVMDIYAKQLIEKLVEWALSQLK